MKKVQKAHLLFWKARHLTLYTIYMGKDILEPYEVYHGMLDFKNTMDWSRNEIWIDTIR